MASAPSLGRGWAITVGAVIGVGLWLVPGALVWIATRPRVAA
jgi:hypothetical protein